MNVHWTLDDLRIIGDIIAGSLLAGALRLIVLKAFLEPMAVYVGQKAYRWGDRALGDRLPNLPSSDPDSAP
jgi:hypothetical protein